MQTNFQKALTSLDKKTYVFHFNRIYAVDGICYHISVRTQENFSHYFMMEGSNGGWYISNKSLLPKWLIEMERKFEAAIIEDILKD